MKGGVPKVHLSLQLYRSYIMIASI